MHIPQRLYALLLSLVLSTTLWAQARQHTVQVGETVYAISRLYDIKPAELLRLNPILGEGDKIRPGQVLTLPAGKKVPAKSTPSPAPRVNTAVQSRTLPPPQQVQTPPEAAGPLKGYLGTDCKEMYRIKRKDNLYRIALEKGLTIEELCAANPGLTPDSKLKKDNFLCIPFSRAEIQRERARLAEERQLQEKMLREQMERQRTPFSSELGKVRVAVILPLKDKGDNGSKMIELYRGLLMAAEQVKAAGHTIEVFAMHSGSGPTAITQVLARPELKQMDLIIGPLESSQAGALSNFCHQHKVRLVMPFSTTQQYGLNNPFAYHASISPEVALRKAVDRMLTHFDKAQVTLLTTGSADDRGADFVSEVRTRLKAKGITPRSLSIEADDEALSAALNAFRDNVIIPDASNLQATVRLTKRLRTFLNAHPEYKVSLVGYPEWVTYASRLMEEFVALDTYVYSTFYRDGEDNRVLQLENRYESHFHTEVARTFPRYALFGYDLGMYFINGIARLGQQFDAQQHTLRFSPLQNAIQFHRDSDEQAHLNQALYLLHFTTGQRIEIIK